jgi:twitching motility protein PilT
VRWIVCQRLLPKEGGGRIAAFEIMGSNLRVKDSILNGESEGKTFYEIIEQSRPFGMMTFDQSISDLYKQKLIGEDVAMSYASRKAIVGRAIDSIKAAKGEKTTDIEGLTIDDSYGKEEKK